MLEPARSEGALREGDLVVMEDRTFDESGVVWKPRAFGMVFKVDEDAKLFWAFWSDEGRDHQDEPCGLKLFFTPEQEMNSSVPYRYRKFA